MEHVLSPDAHERLVLAAFTDRGFSEDEARSMARLCDAAARYGVRTHNVIKALHLDEHLGSGATPPNCRPNAEIEPLDSPFPAVARWNANHKLGTAVGYAAIEEAMRLADTYGIAAVSVDNAFHYLWGGGYVLEAAKRGYIAYTGCTSALTEVVPFGGKSPTLGTNPHSWALPTDESLGFPVLIDWATSEVAMGRVQQFAREGKPLPPGAAVDQDGNPTTDPEAVAALLPFGRHKGYGLSLLDELMAAMIGGSLPTLRCRGDASPNTGEKFNPCFFFQVIRPEAVSGEQFAFGRSQSENLEHVVRDILGHGNENCILPGQIEHGAWVRSEQAGGLIYSDAELRELRGLAERLGVELGEVKPLEG